jgi:ferritin-like metal-binding protein YciE
MAELTTRNAKLVQYLNEAYGKEKHLETALQAHIAMTNRASYKKRLQQHLRETKAHARDVERRIKQLGGAAETVSVPGPDVMAEVAGRLQEAAQRGMALARGPLHAVRGTGEEEMLLKNAKTEYSEEAEEIANYTAIEALAKMVSDRETAMLARAIRQQEERMSSFLEKLIPTLTKAVGQAEIPAAQRRGATGRHASRSRSASRGRSTSARRSPSARSRSGSSARSRSAASRSGSGGSS